MNENNFWELIPSNVIVQETVYYRQMLKKIQEAEFVITDSGGLQEEACILGTPCFTLRKSTERPETVTCGANVILGVDNPAEIFIEHWPFPEKTWEPPFGDGTAARQIIHHALAYLG